MTLRESTARGGLYLAMREVLGIIVRLGGILFLTRQIGPTNYGIYVTAFLFVSVLASVAQLGAEVYLIRRPTEPTLNEYHQTSSLLLVTAVVAIAIGGGLSFVLPTLIGNSDFVAPLRVMLISLPLNVMWAPAQAMIERAFRYKSMAWVELGGDLTLYSVSLIGAYAFNAGVWAPVYGFIAWQAFLLIASHWVAHYLPRWSWNFKAVRSRLRFGGGFAGANVTDQIRQLLNPVLVGRYLGPAAVGRVALALRAVEALSFAGRATWRLALVSFSRVQHDRQRLSRGIS
jgi:O-antigen/teichoic acid export membrane protein